MKLAKFSVERFRSIINRSSFTVYDQTVLIGPNNEGKSNVLRALVCALNILATFAKLSPTHLKLNGKTIIYHRTVLGQQDDYTWRRDYPIRLQRTRASSENKNSIFTLWFQLEDNEFLEFKRLTGTELKNKIIPICLLVNDATIKFTLKIPGHFSKNASETKMIKIAQFITSKIYICYIDAVRTASTAYSSISTLLSIEMKNLSEEEQYKALITKLRELYFPHLTSLAEKLTESLRPFIPNIKGSLINLSRDSNARLDLFNRFNVELDDGETTPLEQKGSGAQSLVALALAHTISKRTNSVDNFILAIEEPEAHLHPDAIHQLRNILHDISSNNQLIITTHSPLLVNTENIDANVIVSNNQAHAAKGKKDIRDTIGVKASDNLLQAENVIIVEGYSDERILKCLLSEYSEVLKTAFEDGSLTIISAHGCSKVLPLLKWVKSGFCKYHIVFDNDEAGQQERANLLSNHNAIDAEITLLANPGMRQSELEDCFDRDIYLPQLQAVFNLTQDRTNILDSNNEKWSARFQRLFASQGLVWDDKTEDRVKSLVADCVVSKGKQAVLDYREGIISSLVEKIERMVESR